VSGALPGSAIAAVLSFLAGSIPFGYLIGRFFYRTDLRTSGSGNIGAMNALRTLGRAGAIAVLLLDAAKGFVPVFLATRAGTFDFHLTGSYFVVGHMHGYDALGALCGIAAILGHCFSPWLGFKGGKGVATSFGVIGAMSWPALLCVIAVWVVAVALVRYSSVGSMAANLASPFALFAFTRSWAFALYGVAAGLLIVWAHRENIARLRSGTENRFTLGKR
jgi:glycerol-3-phosphate acyltransferase PlsY